MGLKILVVGASSGVGLEVTKALIRAGNRFEVFALVRSQEKASDAIGPDASVVNFIHGDITKKETLVAACRGMDATVCSVGAQAGWRLEGSNQNTPKYVDYLGVKNLIEAAVEARVQKFVYVSALAITRPWCYIHILLNSLFGRLMHWKKMAENALRDLYKEQDGLVYSIVRPGGLDDKEGGQHEIIIGQGDTLMGYISRRDVATVCVACINEECPPNVSFEIVNGTKSPPGDLKTLSTLVSDSL